MKNIVLLLVLLTLVLAGVIFSFYRTEYAAGAVTFDLYYTDSGGLVTGQSKLFYRGQPIGTVDRIDLDPECVLVHVCVPGKHRALVYHQGKFTVGNTPDGQIGIVLTDTSGPHTPVENEDIIRGDEGNTQKLLSMTGNLTWRTACRLILHNADYKNPATSVDQVIDMLNQKLDEEQNGLLASGTPTEPQKVAAMVEYIYLTEKDGQKVQRRLMEDYVKNKRVPTIAHKLLNDIATSVALSSVDSLLHAL